MEENQQPKTGKFALNYGLFIAGAGIVFSLMLHFMDMQYDQSAAKQIISTLILVVLIALAVYQFKKANGGFLTLSDSLKIGVGAAAIAAIITILYLLLYINVIEPDFQEKLGEMSRGVMMEKNPELTQEQVDNAVQMQQKFFWVTYPIIIVFNMFIGFIVSLIIGLALKKAKPEY